MLLDFNNLYHKFGNPSRCKFGGTRVDGYIIDWYQSVICSAWVVWSNLQVERLLYS
jgi:hypothetical protein